jgi:hypothetical protein
MERMFQQQKLSSVVKPTSSAVHDDKPLLLHGTSPHPETIAIMAYFFVGEKR